jgi:hypothetical protein
VIDDKEFEPQGFFGHRGIKRKVARERDYVRFEFAGTDAVFEADPGLGENAGFVHWLVCGTGLPHVCGPGEFREKHGGYVMQKHPVPLPGMEHIVAQIRPETAPVTEITYHDHVGMAHQKGPGCPCGAANHRRAYSQAAYNETELKAHEGGGAHADHPALPLVGPHRHTEEGRYMLNPNRAGSPPVVLLLRVGEGSRVRGKAKSGSCSRGGSEPYPGDGVAVPSRDA